MASRHRHTDVPGAARDHRTWDAKLTPANFVGPARAGRTLTLGHVTDANSRCPYAVSRS